MATQDIDKEPRRLQPAAFLTERPKFTTNAVHPSQREPDEHQKNREIITMHRVPAEITHGGSAVDPDDIPEPSEIVDASDLVE